MLLYHEERKLMPRVKAGRALDMMLAGGIDVMDGACNVEAV